MAPDAAVPSVIPASSTPAAASAPSRWRLWVPVTLLLLHWGAIFVTTHLDALPSTRFVTRFFGGVLWILFFVIWWLFQRSMPLLRRAGVLVVAILAAALAIKLAHKSFIPVATLLSGLPFVLTVWTVWIVVSMNFSARARLTGVLIAVTASWIPLLMQRMDGLTGDTDAVLHWRWSPSSEELFLAEHNKNAAQTVQPPAAARIQETPGDWPGFRGPQRDGIVRGLRIATNWNANPPKPLFRRRCGPGWSSLCVVGGRIYTQEQRDNDEAVVCLDARTGNELWAHLDATRFWDGQSGAGPRATPTFADGRIFTFGGTGRLNCLDAATGAVVWTHDAAADTGAPTPIWGFSASPLVAGNVVIVFTGAQPKTEGRGLAAYRRDTGVLAWSVPAGHHSYVSAQAVTLNDVPQVLILSDTGLLSVDAATGAKIWEYAALEAQAWRAIQPHAVGTSDVLITTDSTDGAILLHVTRTDKTWSAAPVWRSRYLKASFDDFAIQGDAIYGFDGGIFTCVSLATGERLWKDGHYGHGQMALLADQNLIVVLTERGEAVLLEAKKDRLNELGRFEALEGKTWNHPVLAHGVLYVRNAEEIAAYDVSETGEKK